MIRRLNVLSALAAVLILIPLSIFTYPEILGFSDAYIVSSGSMSPALPTGSVIFVDKTPPSAIEEGDVITFREGSDAEIQLITHRVIEVRDFGGHIWFKTKGDANPVPDAAWVSEENVVGRVDSSVPQIGHVLNAATTELGRITLVMLPAAIIILLETWKIINITKKEF